MSIEEVVLDDDQKILDYADPRLPRRWSGAEPIKRPERIPVAYPPQTNEPLPLLVLSFLIVPVLLACVLVFILRDSHLGH